MAASTTRHRKSRSLRVASSAENSTSSVNWRAQPDAVDDCFEAGLARDAQLASPGAGPRWRGTCECAAVRPARARAPPPRCPAGGVRASAAITGRRTSRATCRDASKSAGDAMGKPASMMSTPRRVERARHRELRRARPSRSRAPARRRGAWCRRRRCASESWPMRLSCSRLGRLEVKVIIITL